MSHTLTVRLTKSLATWLEQTAKRTGASQSDIVRESLERARTSNPEKPFMRLAGSVRGPKDLSQRRGFERP